jgi:hypothetical protein
MRTGLVGVAAWLLAISAVWALDDADLLFHLSFEQGVSAEFSRGESVPAPATEVEARLVPGLIGRGYRFAGVGSTLEFPVAAGSGRTSREMYDPQVNLLPQAGTVSLWVQPLENSHNLLHRYFFTNGPGGMIQIARNQYTHHVWTGGQRSGVLYDHVLPHGQWFHLALTWREGEIRGYVNGERFTSDPSAQLLTGSPQTFQVAAEGIRWLDFQIKQITDDAVMDEVQLFRRALEPAEVRALFERGQIAGALRTGNSGELVTAPRRAHAPVLAHARKLTSPITPDGDLGEWSALPAHGGFIERRIAVVDDDPGQLWLASDDTHLYLAYRCAVDASIRNDPNHVHYPVGPFAAASDQRDADLADDDHVELIVVNAAGRVHRVAFNSRGALRDQRDGDVAWNAAIAGRARSDFVDWTAEYAIPLADLGVAAGQTVDFNAVRCWKRFKSSQNSLCADARSQPDLGRLTLGSAAVAAVSDLGDVRNGQLRLTGRVTGPDGDYALQVKGGEIDITRTVACRGGGAEFVVEQALVEEGDKAIVVRVLDPAGNPLLTRTLPFVFTRPAQMELESFPGWGKLDVRIAPSLADAADLHATVELRQGSRVVQQAATSTFAQGAGTVRFDLQSAPPGEYLVSAELRQGDRQVARLQQPYTRPAMPEWYGSRAGLLDTPPVPWTEPRVAGQAVQLLGKTITWGDTLLPAQIVTGGDELLAEPMHFVATRGGQSLRLVAGQVQWTQRTAREVRWRSVASQHDLNLEVDGRVEFDGFTWLRITVSGAPVDALALHIPMHRRCATMSTLQPRVGDSTLQTPWYGHWVGHMRGGISWWWEHQHTWTGNRTVTVTPGPQQTVVRIPFFASPTEFASPRSVELGLAITPSRPVRDDWRLLQLAGGAQYANGDYTFITPNYAKPQDTQATYELLRQQVEANVKAHRPQLAWYAFGPYMWVGAPEYRDWWREWRWSDSSVTLPDPSSRSWGSACHRSSASDLHAHLLEQFMARYPQRGLYFDCMSNAPCGNEAHGCGWVAPDGRRLPAAPLLATRRHYERLYNLVKRHDPVLGWVRHHDWGPSPMIAAFCDDNWMGEGDIAAVMASPTDSYFESMDLPRARLQFGKQHWGFLTSWLTELALAVDQSPAGRARVYGAYNPQRQCYELPLWKSVEHVAALFAVHDMWQVGGNDLQLPTWWLQQLYRTMRWDQHVNFVGYWELGDLLTVEGGVEDQVVCSLYSRPGRAGPPEAPYPVDRPHDWADFSMSEQARAYLQQAGASEAGWLILVPMNNTDQEVTVKLRPNFSRMMTASPAKPRYRDIYRAFDYTWTAPPGWKPLENAPTPVQFQIAGRDERFTPEGDTVTVTIPPRSFRMLLLESAEN